ncbi:MAG: hypothetical protein IJR65_04030 [Oscillospiraceae bacterium]|nr:hypothetical protein [Oscillospiraceae bacterium]
MNIQRLYDCVRPRHRVWCLAAELTAGESAGTYQLNDTAVAGELGFGSELVVIDKPGTVLFWDDAAALAYEWTTADGGGDDGTDDGGGEEVEP